MTESREWIIQVCLSAGNNVYEDWTGYCERLMTRREMLVALAECENTLPEYAFRGHNVMNQQRGADTLRIVR